MLRISALLLIVAAGGVSQDFTDLKIEKVVAVGFRFTNGPVWSHEGALLFCDQPANHVIHWEPGRQPDVFLDDAPGASGLAFDTQGRLYVCEGRSRRIIRIDQKKRIQTVVEKYQGKRL